MIMEPNPQGEVWVVAEHATGSLAAVSLEILGRAHRLASELGVSAVAVVLGSQAQPLAQELLTRGAARVRCLGLDPADEVQEARALSQLIQRHRPRILLLGATRRGRSLAGRISAALGTALLADCTDLWVGSVDGGDPRLLGLRPSSRGRGLTTVAAGGSPSLATVCPGALPLPERQQEAGGETVTEAAVAAEPSGIVVHQETAAAGAAVPDLEEARVVVTAGAGVGSPEGFALVQELAGALGAAVGASRAAVTLGLAPPHLRVGHSGVTVRPDLYVACGVSGAAQHRAGMARAGCIVSINQDPEAPILEMAHYGIVGDLRTVIPQLIETLRQRQPSTR